MIRRLLSQAFLQAIIPKYAQVFTLDIDDQNQYQVYRLNVSNQITFENLDEVDIPYNASENSYTIFSSSNSLTRILTVPLHKAEDIKKALPYVLEDFLPQDLSQGSYTFEIVQTENSQSKILVCWTPHDTIAEIKAKNRLKNSALIPKPHAVWHYAKEYATKDIHTLFIYMDWQETILMSVHNGLLKSIRTLPRGLTYIKEILEKYALDANDEKEPYELLTFLKEITLILLEAEKEVQLHAQLSFLGTLIDQELLQKIIKEFLKRDLVQPESQKVFDILPDKQNTLAAICGAVHILTGPVELNTTILYQMKSPIRALQRFQIPLLAATLSSILLCSTIFGYFTYKKTQLNHTIQEKAEKLIATAKQNIFSFAVQTDTNNIDTLINDLEEKLEEEKNEMAFMPSIASVQNVFSFLTPFFDTHPSLRLRNFDYNLTKYPSLQSPHEHYEVRIDFECTTQTPHQLVKTLNEFLRTKDSIADLKRELKIVLSKDSIRVTFYAKDKTTYT